MKTKYGRSRVNGGGKHNKYASYVAYMKAKYRGGAEELEVKGEASIIEVEALAFSFSSSSSESEPEAESASPPAAFSFSSSQPLRRQWPSWLTRTKTKESPGSSLVHKPTSSQVLSSTAESFHKTNRETVTSDTAQQNR